MDDRDDDIGKAVRAALDATGVPYEVLDCDPDFADTAAQVFDRLPGAEVVAGLAVA
jgi:hypothetical protein